MKLSTGPCFLLFVVFLVLKLTAVIDWSWWWITSPLWIPVGLTVVGFVVMWVSAVIVIAVATMLERK